MYLACIGILWNRGIFLVIPSGSSDFAARIKAFPLLYWYSSPWNLYGSRFFSVLDTGWFQSFPGTVKSVRNTASTIRCDFRSSPVGKTGDSSGVDWGKLAVTGWFWWVPEAGIMDLGLDSIDKHFPMHFCTIFLWRIFLKKRHDLIISSSKNVNKIIS